MFLEDGAVEVAIASCDDAAVYERTQLQDMKLLDYPVQHFMQEHFGKQKTYIVGPEPIERFYHGSDDFPAIVANFDWKSTKPAFLMTFLQYPWHREICVCATIPPGTDGMASAKLAIFDVLSMPEFKKDLQNDPKAVIK